MTLMSAPLALCGVMVILIMSGAAMLRRGVRGRRVDEHPLCRKCGFDLVGMPHDGSRCPECGVDIRRDGAVRIGHYQKLPKSIVAGVILLLLAIACALPLAALAMPNFDWQQYKPIWWLKREAVNSNSSTRTLALNEILRRQAGKLLSDSQSDSLITSALAVQADIKKTWDVQWGAFVERARADGKIDDERWTRYLQNAIVWEVYPRARVARGDPLPFWIVTTKRCGQGSGIVSRSDQQQSSVTIDGKSIGSQYLNEFVELDARYGGKSGNKIKFDEILNQLADGKHRIEFKSHRVVLQSANPDSKVLTKHDTVMSGGFELLPAGVPSATIVESAASRDQIAKTVTATSLSEVSWRSGMFAGTISFQARPMDVAYAVYVVTGDKKQLFGQIAIPIGPGGHSWGLQRDIDIPPDAKTVDLLLVPDVQAATNSPDAFTICGGEITIKNMKVERLPSTTTAPSR